MEPNDFVGVWAIPVEGKEEFATGYPVADGLILTVGHVFPEARKHLQEVEVVFLHRDGNPVAAEVLWCGLWRVDGIRRCDAALLRCTFPDGVRTKSVLLSACPAGPKIDWACKCYARVKRNDGIPQTPLDVTGTFLPPADDQPHLPLQPTGFSREQLPSKDWEGASGAPVFVGSRIAAILTGTQQFEDGKLQELTALPVWRFINDSDFIEHFGGVTIEAQDESDKQWVAKLAKRLKRMFRDLESSEVAEELADKFDLMLESEDQPLKASPQALGTLVDAIIKDLQRIRDLTEIRRFCRQKGLRNDQRQLEEVENALLPLRFPPDERRRFWNDLKHRKAILIEQAVQSLAGAESRMSAIDQRPSDFSVTDPIPDPVAADSAASDPGDVAHWRGEAGLFMTTKDLVPDEVTAQSVAVQILDQLADCRLSASQRPAPSEAWRDLRLGKVTFEEKPDALAKFQHLAGVLNETLGWRTGTQYCVIRVCDDASVERSLLIDALELVAECVPQLEFLELSSDSPHALHEAPVLEVLRSRIEKPR